jgi:hypothetical protein
LCDRKVRWRVHNKFMIFLISILSFIHCQFSTWYQSLVFYVRWKDYNYIISLFILTFKKNWREFFFREQCSRHNHDNFHLWSIEMLHDNNFHIWQRMIKFLLHEKDLWKTISTTNYDHQKLNLERFFSRMHFLTSFIHEDRQDNFWSNPFKDC